MSLGKGTSPGDRAPGQASRARAGEQRVGGASLVFRLDPSSGVPTYAQLVQQVERALRLGYLRPKDQLPRVREVVNDLAINPNTVLKAYKELEGKGLVVGRPGQGTFVEESLEQVDLARLVRVRRALVDWLGRASSVGLDEDGIVALFTTTLREFLDGADRPDAGAARRHERGAPAEETA